MSTKKPSRRSFLKSSATGAAAIAATGSLGALRAASPVHQGGGELKIGIVGVGGRGSGAALQAIMADKENMLYAAGDAFADRMEDGLDAVLESATEAGREKQFQVSPERRFVGIDA
ncbi:MAG: myo-inositol 2-dehydrogenase/D-chiro-inositol 1-dehydrogenase, partial [Hyphomicrobiaceae bacterium]